MKHAARGSLKIQDTKKSPKNRHLGTIAQLCRAISLQLRHISTIGKKNLLSCNMSSTCPRNMANFGLLAAEIDPVVWGTPANFNGFCVLAALLHGSQVLSISQTLRCWTEGTTYVRQGDHYVWRWPTFLVIILLRLLPLSTSCASQLCAPTDCSLSINVYKTHKLCSTLWLQNNLFNFQFISMNIDIVLCSRASSS